MAALARAATWPLLLALVASGLVELVFLRLLYRVGLFIPRGGPLLDAFRAATALGSFAFDLVSVLALVALTVRAGVAWRERPVRSAALLAVLIFALAVPFAPAPWAGAARTVFAASALTAAMVISFPALLTRAAPTLDRLAIALVALVVATAQYAALAGAAEVSIAAPLAAVRVAEVAALAGAFAFAAATIRHARPGGFALALALLAALALGAALALQPYLAGIVLLWSTGLSLWLPAPLYVAALAAFGGTIVNEARRPTGARRAIALLLLLVAGVVPQSTAHAAVALLALDQLVEDMTARVRTWPEAMRDVRVAAPAAVSLDAGSWGS